MRAKKFLSLALCAAMASCIGLSACGDDNKDNNPPAGDNTDKTTPVQLTAPVISLDDNVISWSAVENATGYDVYEGENKVNSQTGTSFTVIQTAVGSYVYTVYATSTDSSKFTKSEASNAVTYTVENKTVEPTQLDAPVISLTDNVITWSAVGDATGYEVYLGDNLILSTENTSYTVSQTEEGSYVYTVYAVNSDTSKFTRSEASNAVTYTVKGEIQSVTLEASKKIYVVGDSTVCDFEDKDNYYIRRYGYGTQLYNFLNLTSASQVVNLALSGRSSKSFLTESNYSTLKNSIGAGDFLIIGFGHNDEKSAEPARFTDPNADYTTATTAKGDSFQYVLYENYVKLAKEKGATPILCTPIVRYNPNGSYDNNDKVHVTADGDYAAAIKKLGADTNTAVVDLTQITKEFYAAHNDEAKNFHAFTTYTGADKTPDGMDATHINKYGAKQIAYWLLDNLPASCPLVNHVKIDGELDSDVEYAGAINSAYVKPDYNGFDPAGKTPFATTTTNDTTASWFKTVTGVLGGATKVGNYSFADDKNGKLTITADKGSKFAAAQDGFGAIFVQVDISKNFTATAKAKVTAAAVSVNDQAAFGMMLRDDIYIDTEVTTLASNFVSTSVTGGSKVNMSRTSSNALSYGNNSGITYALDNEYEFTITRVGQTVTAIVKQGAKTVTTTFTDVSFVGVDNTKMYLCLFANRGLTVEFTDVTFEITGEAQGA
ncbi:MAG: hypothetical protein K2N23_02860 [Clostridia bacterium]|nr:hypothetical protein [Clostridia bacterium]